MDELLGHPTTCPHGNPIPGSDFEQRDLIALSEAEVGVPVVIRRITEELEFQPGLLEFLEAASIRPGETVSLASAAPDGTLTVQVGDDALGVAAFTGERILVST
jgi:DtxR family Mn-dependent transcriptional regulator